MNEYIENQIVPLRIIYFDMILEKLGQFMLTFHIRICKLLLSLCILLVIRMETNNNIKEAQARPRYKLFYTHTHVKDVKESKIKIIQHYLTIIK